jgi:UDP-N-acetylglucosamine 2-epimerase
MIEEINRRVVDSFSALLCAPSVAAADRLRSERVAGTVVQTGDVARDVLGAFQCPLPLRSPPSTGGRCRSPSRSSLRRYIVQS